MKTRDTKEIKTAYDNARFDIDSLMNLLEMELAEPQDHPNRGHVLTMKHVKNELLELVSHLTDRSTDTLREALDEFREDSQLLTETKNA